jgi:hypothetical protein
MKITEAISTLHHGMENKTITAISQGSQDILYYKIASNGVTEINRALKPIEEANGGISRELVVYQVMSSQGMICEIEADNGIVLWF